jgi:hypothetical protein
MGHMERSFSIALVAGFVAAAGAQVQGQHHFSWWDDAQLGVMITPTGAPPPTPGAVHLFDLDEWHLNQTATTQWYAGGNVAGVTAINPFNAGNRNGMTVGSAIVPINNAELFVYQLTNVNYGAGNGVAAPFSFTNGVGTNDLSGINISDIYGALNIASPVTGSQFMFSHNIPNGSILDLTPTAAGIGASQDWDFNAYSGAGNFEWDIQETNAVLNGVGGVIGLPPLVFGYAMPGVWFDGVGDGWVHSWNAPGGGVVPTQVNLAAGIGGFSSPMIPTPATLLLLIGGGVVASRRSRP